MAARLWQVVMGLVLAAGLALAVNDIVVKPFQPLGYDGISAQTPLGAPAPLAGRIAYRVNAVDAGSPMAAANVAPGDVLVPATSIYRQTAVPGVAERVVVLHAGQAPRSIEIVQLARQRSLTDVAQMVLLGLVRVAYLLVAIVLVLRRPEHAVARALVLFLLGFGTINTWLYDPYPLSAVAATLGHVCWALSLIGLISFCTLVAGGPQGVVRERAAVIGLGFALVAACSFIANGIAVGFFGSALWLSGLPQVVLYFALVGVYAAALCLLALAYRDAPAMERLRLRWIVVSFAAGMAGPAVLITGEVFALPLHPAVAPLVTVTQLSVPLGLGYAILRHRLVDLGFVLNRTAVYAALSAIIVPLFSVLEWGADRYVSTQNRTASALIELAIAMGIVLAFRRLHARVESLVDRVLFGKRHRDEAALREFAGHAHFIRSREALVNRCAETVQERTGASGAAIYLRYGGESFMRAAQRGENRLPALLDDDDQALVAARAELRPLASVERGALAGALVLPFVVRGELTGLLACAPKLTGDSYAPDERLILAGLATNVAWALDGLRIRDLEAQLAELSARHDAPQRSAATIPRA